MHGSEWEGVVVRLLSTPNNAGCPLNLWETECLMDSLSPFKEILFTTTTHHYLLSTTKNLGLRGGWSSKQSLFALMKLLDRRLT